MKQEFFQKEFDKLNTFQKKAVETMYWPVMVVAGPWTWKTQIIALRTANIIKNTSTKPQNILITTFTEAWVIAIKKRLEAFLWADWYKVNVSTIHSFCQDVINTFPEKFLEFKAWTPIDDVDSLEVLKNIIDNLVLNWEIKELTNEYDRFFYLTDIKSRIWTLKQEWITFDEFSQKIKDQSEKYIEILGDIKPTLKKYESTKQAQEKHINKLNELNIIYKKYQEVLAQTSRYDFNDMINFVVAKFRIDADLRYFYAEKYEFIMLDEYQDTNNAQNTIIDLILSTETDANSQNIMVVGDDDQSIYRFQWANIENMLDFSIKYPDLTTVVLENNYRSNQAILDLCTTSIENNSERLTKRISTLEKKLISSHPTLKEDKNMPIFSTFNTIEEERVFLLENIKKDLEKIPKSEIAIIVRSNKEVEELSRFFIQNQVDVVSKQNTNILKNNYVIFLLKLLKVLQNPNQNDANLIDILRNNILWLSQIDIFKLSKHIYNLNYTKKYKISVFEKFLEFENITDITWEKADKLTEIRDIFKELIWDLSWKNFVEFFNILLSKFKIIDFIQTNWTFDDIEDIYTFFNKISSYSQNDNSFSLEKLLHKIELFETYNFSIPRQILKKQKDWIQILTAHSSKWLEYEKVYVSWLYNGNWDNKRTIDKLKLPTWIAWIWLQTEVDPIEEDRRLFFVACSRAKRELIITSPLSKNWKILLLSSFIKETEGCYETKFFEIENAYLTNSITNILENNLVSYSNLEFDYIKEFIENYKLSPTDLNIFLEDPKEFLNRVVFKYPFIDNNATIFWKVYHRVLELFYAKYHDEKKLPPKSYLTSVFKLLLEKEILDLESFNALLEKWTKWLEGFYETYKNNSRWIAYLEYNLRSKWLSYEWIPITWKIDKIEIIWNINTNNENNWQLAFFKESVALVDYKTWKVKSIWEIKWTDRDWNRKENEWKYFRQLMFYKLLCSLDTDFTSKYDISALALDFVEWRDWNYKYIEVPYTNEDYDFFLNELTTSWEKISNIEYWKEILK